MRAPIVWRRDDCPAPSQLQGNHGAAMANCGSTFTGKFNRAGYESRTGAPFAWRASQPRPSAPWASAISGRERDRGEFARTIAVHDHLAAGIVTVGDDHDPGIAQR